MPIKFDKLFEMRVGNNGAKLYFGYAAFTTSATTVEVPVPFKRLLAFVPVPVGAPNANEPLSVSETFTGEEAVVNGAVTVIRAAGTTSGLGFTFIAIGR
jgi:hypothetical protein